jgi:hypothetical protein
LFALLRLGPLASLELFVDRALYELVNGNVVLLWVLRLSAGLLGLHPQCPQIDSVLGGQLAKDIRAIARVGVVNLVDDAEHFSEQADGVSAASLYHRREFVRGLHKLIADAADLVMLGDAAVGFLFAARDDLLRCGRELRPELLFLGAPALGGG